jgi:AcrR family transcriptional regulator
VNGSSRPGGRGGDSRERILAAAAEVAAEHGYGGTTIAKVTRRAGLPASSVYWFFKDKDDLLAEVVTHWVRRWAAAQPPWPAPEPGTSVADRLRSVLVPSYQRITAAPELMSIGFALLLESFEQEPTARVRFLEVRREMLRRARESLEVLLRSERVDDVTELAERLAQLVLVATDGLFLTVRLGVEVDIEGYVDLLVAVVEQAVEDASADR